MTVEALEKELKTGKLHSIYLLYGEERFLLETILKKIKKSFGDLVTGINYITLDDTNVEELIADLQTPAFGYPKKLIIAKNTGLFKKEGKKANPKLAVLKEKVSTYFKEELENIKEYTVVIFVEEEIEKKGLYQFIEKEGIVCQFEKQKPAQLVKRLKAIYQAYGVTIEENTIHYLIEQVGTGMQELMNESRKLIEYAGKGGKIGKEEVDLLCIRQVEAVIFTLTDSLGKKEITKAFATFHDLLYQKEPVQKILIMLYHHFKKLYLTKIAIEKKEEITEALNLKPNQLFLTHKYKAQAAYFSKDELKKILEELIVLDKNSKIGLIDVQVGLEAVLSNYCS